MNGAKTMRVVRQVHLYLGMFFAPAILFFAVSGMLQTFEFHEGRNHPPGWIAVIAALHKKQDLPRPRPPRAEGKAPKRGERGEAPPPAHSPFPLKVFVGLMSLGLLASTLLGIWIALSLRVSRRLSLVMLAAGTLLPLAFILP